MSASDLEAGGSLIDGESQWLLDYVVQASGRMTNFELEGRELPNTVKNAAMVPAAYYRKAEQQERIARRAEAAGQDATALDLYFKAVQNYRHAQHAIPRDDDAEKLFFHQRMSECYDRVIALSAYPMERVDIQWEGHTLSGIFHMLADRRRAPTVLWLPGMDNTKEGNPDPSNNFFAARGMNVLAIDGPGQGVAGLRKVRLTADNYQRAGVAFIDWLTERPEVDADRIVISGSSMGSHWGMRIASIDQRVRAVATTSAVYGSLRLILRSGSPRYREVFAYMTGVRDPATLDRIGDEMHLLDTAPDITCPVLMITGEFDPLCSLRDTHEVFERLRCPKELWVVEDQFHNLSGSMPNFGGLSSRPFLADWLRQAVDGGFPSDHSRAVLVRRSGVGPFDEVAAGFWYPERSDKKYLA